MLGGIGTTAEGLRAGCPLIVVPHAHDQFDNARRVRMLGAGVIVPRNTLTPARLGVAIEAATTRCVPDALGVSRRVMASDAGMADRFVGAVEGVVRRGATVSARATSADPSRAAAGCATG